VQTQGRPLAVTVWFTAGYFLVWVSFALLATGIQWAFEPAALLDPAISLILRANSSATPDFALP
jgi:predicted metal-binding membrane protein